MISLARSIPIEIPLHQPGLEIVLFFCLWIVAFCLAAGFVWGLVKLFMWIGGNK
jgi:hypothetical protein